MRFSLPLGLAGAAALVAVVLAQSAVAGKAQARPVAPTPVRELRSLADHYRTLTWTFERAARDRRTPTSFSYRRTRNRHYLRWTIDLWTRRAYTVRTQVLAEIHRRFAVALPRQPALRAPLRRRVAYARHLALRLRGIYPGSVSRRFAAARSRDAHATLRLWQLRSAAAAVGVVAHAVPRPPVPSFLESAFWCIHHYEGAWNANTGNGYYGGLQMDMSFQSRYAPDYLGRWGTAEKWPPWAQVAAAVRAYRSGRGFGPWPSTARVCGLM